MPLKIHKSYQWRGEPLRGRRLVVFFDAGYGDSFQCARFVRPFLAAIDGPVTFIVPPQLAALFRQSFPEVDVRSEYPLPPAHKACHALHQSDESWYTFVGNRGIAPAWPPYLAARAPRQLDGGGARQVGTCWRGNGKNAWKFGRFDRYRSIHDVKLLAPLWDVPGVRWQSLQFGDLGPPSTAMTDHRSELRDWTETADLIAGLDLVITVDTAVAHLSGALGVPVWVLVRPVWPIGTRYNACNAKMGDMRWEGSIRVAQGRPVEPAPRRQWLYPSAHIFRQTKPGDWAPVIDSVRAALEQFTSIKVAA